LINRKKIKGKGVLADSTLKHHRASVQHFFQFLWKAGLTDFLPTFGNTFIPSKKSPPPILKLSQVYKLVRKVKPLETKVMILCAYACGLRRSEIVSLNLEDIHLIEEYIQVKNGKFGKARRVPIARKVFRYFERYIEKCCCDLAKHKIQTPLFINRYGERLTGGTLNKRFKRGLELIGIDSNLYSLHCLRRSISVHLTEAGAGLEYVQQFLGHESIDTTNRYAIERRRSNSIMRAFQ